jgi:hypothetical protein
MSNVATVWLSKPIMPGGQTWVKGYITSHDTKGVVINSRDDWGGEAQFIPTHLIERIVYNTGW